MITEPLQSVRGLGSRVEAPAFWGLLGVMAAMLLLVGPILTSDGPAHVSIAHFLRHAGDPAWPQLNRVYEVNPTLSPNSFGHLVLAGLMFLLSPLQAELIVQMVCLLGIPLAGRLVLRQISPSAGWLALFFFPVALQRLFYLGLYNFSLSYCGFLLSLWAWLRLREQPTAGRTACLAAMLLLTLAAQASGWMEAASAIGAMLVVEAALARQNGQFRDLAFRLFIATGVAFVPGLMLFILFAAASVGGEQMTYGAPPLLRLTEVLVGVPFATIGRATAGVSAVLGLVLFVGVAFGLTTLWRRSRLPATSGADRPVPRLVLSLCAALLGLLAFLMIVPERAAGGWSHVWRAEAFPYAGLALVAAAVPMAGWLRSGAFALAIAGGPPCQ